MLVNVALPAEVSMSGICGPLNVHSYTLTSRTATVKCEMTLINSQNQSLLTSFAAVQLTYAYETDDWSLVYPVTFTIGDVPITYNMDADPSADLELFACGLSRLSMVEYLDRLTEHWGSFADDQLLQQRMFAHYLRDAIAGMVTIQRTREDSDYLHLEQLLDFMCSIKSRHLTSIKRKHWSAVEKIDRFWKLTGRFS